MPDLPYWRFNPAIPGYKNREAMQGEFFATGTDVEALVREAIQNSLDAKRPQHDAPTRVRIYLSGTGGAREASQVAPFLKGAWQHFLQPASGLQNPPAQKDRCPFIVIEDFETTGRGVGVPRTRTPSRTSMRIRASR